MPLYEFRCSECGTEFEFIVFLTDQEPVRCPECGAANPERLLSIFSSGKGASDLGPSTSPSCRTPARGFT